MPTANRTPILVPNDDFPVEVVRRRFLSRSTQIAGPIRDLVLAKIDDFAS
jgi:hypothetical protein